MPVGCSAPINVSVKQPLQLRLREKCRRMDGKVVRARGPGSLPPGNIY